MTSGNPLRSDKIQHKIDTLQVRVNRDYQDLEARKELTLIFLDAFEFSLALEHIEFLLKQDPGNHEYLFLAALSYSGVHQFTQAIDSWMRIKDFDGNPILFRPKNKNLSTVAQKVAVLWAQRARKNSDNIQILYQTGLAALSLYFLRNAEQALLRVQQVNPKFEDVHYWLGVIALENQDPEQALRHLHHHVQSRPRDLKGLFLAAKTLKATGKYTQSKRMLAKILEYQNRHFAAHYQLGILELEQKNQELALKHLGKATMLNPNSGGALYALGQAHEQAFEMDEAVQHYEQAHAVNPDNIENLASLAKLLKKLGSLERSKSYFEELIVLDPEHEDAHYYLALTYLTQKDVAKAVPLLEKTIKLAPHNLFAQYSLAKAYLDLNLQKKAEPILESLLEANPSDTRIHTLLGRLKMQQNELTRATRHFDKALTINPKDAESNYFKGICHFKLYDYGHAIEAFKKASQAPEGSALHFFSEGALLSHQRRYKEAVAMYHKATDVFPEEDNDIRFFSTLQLLGVVGIEVSEAGRDLQEFAKKRDDLFKVLVLSLSHFLDARDKYTRYHSRRVAHIGSLLATKGLENVILSGDLDPSFRLSEEQLTGVVVGGLLHDIGKIGIPDHVLNKPGKLTDEEYELIKLHPVIGEEGLRSVPFPWPEVLPIIRHHHEKWNGHGYPDKLIANDIPFEAQIIGVADFYDALTTNRPYRKAFTPEKSLAIMEEEAGKFFNPVLVQAFASILDEIKRVPEAPTDETGQYIFSQVEDAFDTLKLSSDVAAEPKRPSPPEIKLD